MCPNKKKSGQKKFQRNPSSVPEKKRVSQEVPQVSPNNKKNSKKKVQILFHPFFSGLVTSFKISPPLLGTISEKGDETKKRDETEYETQEDFIDNFITWSLI